MEETNQNNAKKDDGGKNRKRMLVFIGSLVIAVIFVTSIAGLSGNSGPNPLATTTVAAPIQTHIAIGYANAVVFGYGNKLLVTVANDSANDSATVGNLLNVMFNNGTVLQFQQPTLNSYAVYAGNFTAYQIAAGLLSAVSDANSISLGLQLSARLPGSVVLYISGNPVTVIMPNDIYSFGSNSLATIGSAIPVKVSAYIYQNATVRGVYNVYGTPTVYRNNTA